MGHKRERSPATDVARREPRSEPSKRVKEEAPARDRKRSLTPNEPRLILPPKAPSAKYDSHAGDRARIDAGEESVVQVVASVSEPTSPLSIGMDPPHLPTPTVVPHPTPATVVEGGAPPQGDKAKFKKDAARVVVKRMSKFYSNGTITDRVRPVVVTLLRVCLCLRRTARP